MAILRNKSRERWTVIDNDAIEDDRLSLEAVGVLAILLSKPDRWKIINGFFTKSARPLAPGRDKFNRIKAELIGAGYLEVRPLRGAGGRVEGSELILHESPRRDTDKPNLGRADSRLTPSLGDSSPLVSNNKQLVTTEGAPGDTNKQPRPSKTPPADYAPTAAVVAFCETYASTVNWKIELEKFKTKERKRAVTNWDLAFRNWIVTAHGYAIAANPNAAVKGPESQGASDRASALFDEQNRRYKYLHKLASANGLNARGLEGRELENFLRASSIAFETKTPGDQCA